MNTMNASYFIEKVGHGILIAFLLAAPWLGRRAGSAAPC